MLSVCTCVCMYSLQFVVFFASRYELHWLTLRPPRAPMYLLRNSRPSKTVASTHSGNFHAQLDIFSLSTREVFFASNFLMKKILQLSRLACLPFVCHWVVKPVSLNLNSKTLNAVLLHQPAAPNSYLVDENNVVHISVQVHISTQCSTQKYFFSILFWYFCQKDKNCSLAFVVILDFDTLSNVKIQTVFWERNFLKNSLEQKCEYSER